MSNSKSILRDFLADRYVMVVEPATNYKNSLKRFLSNLKVTKVKLVSTAAEARREMLTTSVGLFIVEWKLADKNGLQFCRDLHKDPIYREIPFLLTSVENLRNDVVLAGEIGVDGYLLKPFSYDDFCNQVETIVQSIRNPSKLNSLLSDAYDKLNADDLDKAEELFNFARESNPDSARALCGMAKVLDLRGNLEGAQALYHRSIQVNPEFIEAHRGLLEIFEKLGDLQAVLDRAHHINQLSPDNPKYMLIIAKTLLDMQQLQESESYFKKVIRLSPKLAEAYKGLGNVYMLKEDYEEAMKNFEKALDLDKSDISTINSIGLSYVRIGKLKEGIQMYRTALKLSPFDARVLFNLGYAYEKLGNNQEALHYYHQALTYEPGYDKAHRGIERLRAAS